jgi:hypothetical protein
MKKATLLMAAALSLVFLPAYSNAASANGITQYYDTEERGHFFCGGPPTTWSKIPIIGTVGRVVAGKGYVAGVYVKQVPRSASNKGALVRFGIRVDGSVRLAEQEYSIDDLSLGSVKRLRNFRVSVLEKKSVLTGSGTRFGPDGANVFRSVPPGTLNTATEWRDSQSIKVVCATPEDFQEQGSQDQLSSDLELLIKLIGVRSRGRVFRSN